MELLKLMDFNNEGAINISECDDLKEREIPDKFNLLKYIGNKEVLCYLQDIVNAAYLEGYIDGKKETGSQYY